MTLDGTARAVPTIIRKLQGLVGKIQNPIESRNRPTVAKMTANAGSLRGILPYMFVECYADSVLDEKVPDWVPALDIMSE